MKLSADALKRMNYFTVEEISTPKDGYVCLLDKWWALSDDGKVMIYHNNSPQCNSNKDIAIQISKATYSGDVKYIKCAFIPAELE